MEVVASLSQGRTAAAQCGLFTHKSVPVIFEPPCIFCRVTLTPGSFYYKLKERVYDQTGDNICKNYMWDNSPVPFVISNCLDFTVSLNHTVTLMF